MLEVHTERLDLIAATTEHLDAELGSPARLAALLHAHVPEDWPPGEYDRPAIEFFRERLAGDPAAGGWYVWYAVERPAGAGPALLVGAGGYLGPPAADGSVEVGYSILPGFRGRGFATELVAALVARAFEVSDVTRVVAHTHPDNVASVRVLERAGFGLVGAGEEPGTVQYARLRPAASPSPGAAGTVFAQKDSDSLAL